MNTTLIAKSFTGTQINPRKLSSKYGSTKPMNMTSVLPRPLCNFQDKTGKKSHKQLLPPSKVSMDEISRIVQYDSYIITKGVLLFFMFYSTLNWYHYRSIRKETENEENNNKK